MARMEGDLVRMFAQVIHFGCFQLIPTALADRLMDKTWVISFHS